MQRNEVLDDTTTRAVGQRHLAQPIDAGGGARTYIDAIRQSLDEAMREIRTICGGLVLPQIETASLSDLLRQSVQDIAAVDDRFGNALGAAHTKAGKRRIGLDGIACLSGGLPAGAGPAGGSSVIAHTVSMAVSFAVLGIGIHRGRAIPAWENRSVTGAAAAKNVIRSQTATEKDMRRIGGAVSFG